MSTDKYKYDYFISYAEDAEGWVRNYLSHKLRKAGKKHLLQQDIEQSGKSDIAAVADAISESHKTIFVISHRNSYTHLAKLYEQMVLTKGAIEQDWQLLPILIHPIKFDSSDLLRNTIPPINWEEKSEREKLWVELGSSEEELSREKDNTPSPYPGMKSFEKSDSQNFFGRQKEIKSSLDRLRSDGFLTLIGPSGCGKSSLVRAGIIPALTSSNEDLLIETYRPSEKIFTKWLYKYGEDIFDHPDKLINQLLSESNADKLLLFIDQFEEVFALDQHTQNQQLLQLGKQAELFVKRLSALRKAGALLVITVRDDFFSHLGKCSEWLNIDLYLLRVGALSREGLADAISKPAMQCKHSVDPVLVERLVNDAGNDPGILPFVQETLDKLWEEKEERYLTLKAYEQMGTDNNSGLHSAIAAKADSAMRKLLDDKSCKDCEEIAQRIFIRLIQFGEDGRKDTRRQQPVSQLQSEQDSEGVFDKVLEHFSSDSHRLLVLSGGDGDESKVDIVHEALIEAWPQLQEWIIRNKNNEIKKRSLDLKVNSWANSKNKDRGLLDIYDLKEFEKWINITENKKNINKKTLEFLEISRKEINPKWNLKGIISIVILITSILILISSMYEIILKIGSIYYFIIFVLLTLILMIIGLGGKGKRFRFQHASHSWASNKKISLLLFFIICSLSLSQMTSNTSMLSELRCSLDGVNTDKNAFKNIKNIHLKTKNLSPVEIETFIDSINYISGISTIYTTDIKPYCKNFFTEEILISNDGNEYYMVARSTQQENKYIPLTRDTFYASKTLSKCAAILDLTSQFFASRKEFYRQKIYPASCKAISAYNICKNEYFKGNKKLAIQKCQESIADSKSFIDAYMLLSRVLIKSGDIDTALKLLSNIKDKDSSDHALFAAIGRIHLYKKNFELAESFYKKSINTFKHSLYYNQLSVIYMKMNCKNCMEVAKNSLDIAVKLNNNEKIDKNYNKSAILKNLGVFYSKSNNYKKSNNLFNSIDKEYKRPYINEISFFLSVNSLKQKNTIEGCKLLNKYLELSDNSTFGLERTIKAKEIMDINNC